MKKVLFVSISCCIVFFMTAINTFAVEYPTDDEIDKQEVADYSNDTSLNSAQKLIDQKIPLSLPEQNIDDMVDNFLNNAGYYQGLNDDKDTILAIGQSSLDCKDPSYDNSFIIKRSLKTMEAVLNAKAQIIEFIEVEMSILDKATTPGTDLNAQYRNEVNALEKEIEAQKHRVAGLLEHVDSAEAEALKGADSIDRINKLIDAVIKKLDPTYSSGGIEKEKLEQFKKVKDLHQAAIIKSKELEAKLKAFSESETETLTSDMVSLSKMPLLGGTIIGQFEQWNESEQVYETRVVMLWSKKMEKVVRAFISGRQVKVPVGNLSIGQYIQNNDWSSSAGGRRFRDNKGNVYFIGIGAAAVGSSSSSAKRARGIAELIAKKEVATAIFADVESYKKANQKMTGFKGEDGKDETLAVESYIEEVSQSIESRSIKGLSKRYGRKVVHPISGQKIYVSIYAISGESARQALLMQESNYISRIMDVKSQQQIKGNKAGHEAAVQKAEANQSAYRQSQQKAMKNVTSKASPSPSNSSMSSQQQNTYSAPKKVSGSGAQSGAFSGGGQDDISW